MKASSDDILFWTGVSVLVALSALLYVLPTIIAFQRRHYYKWIIFAINLVTGASGIGYLVALIWALWPRQTGVADVLLNDPTTNSTKANQVIYSRYGANLKALNQARIVREIYVLCGQQSTGPYSIEEIRARIQSGEIATTDLAWEEGHANWAPLSDIPDFRFPPARR